MAGGSKGIRRALGALKDSTTVGLAKVNSEYKELDIAIVKATNHVESPPKEKHVRTIFLATAASRPRADVAYCIHALAKRIAKTHTWTVAVKALIVIHRTLREGDPTFREELVNYSRNRGHILNLSNFKDDSSPNAWDYSAWVRTYALFLEERLECFRLLKYDVESERSSGYSRTRELDTLDLLEQLPALQQLLHRLMGCQPEGAAMANYVIQCALGLVFKESFKLYRAINDGIINLVDKFFEMQRHDAIKALEIYKRAGQQAERLSEFYETCKGLDIARSFQFPTLEQVLTTSAYHDGYHGKPLASSQPPQSFLTTMEEYVREAPRLAILPKEIPLQLEYHNGPSAPAPEPELVDEPTVPPPVPEETKQPSPAHDTDDLLGLGDLGPTPSALDESNALALAIVPGPSEPSASNGTWNPESGTTGWELALVTNPSSNESALSSSRLAGGFDKQVLDSLYDNALTQRQPAAGSSYGQVSNPFEMHHDPFVASGKFAPPPNVQMANMAQHQQALYYQQQQLQQQQHHQQQMMAMAHNVHNPFAAAPPPPGPGFHQNNPFSNSGLL